MANIHGIEVSNEVYDLEDTTARNGVQENTSSIGEIEAVVPSSASSSNPLATQSDVPDVSQLETDIEDIQAVVPSSASSSNKLVTQNDVKNVTSGTVGGKITWNRNNQVVCFYLTDDAVLQPGKTNYQLPFKSKMQEGFLVFWGTSVVGYGVIESGTQILEINMSVASNVRCFGMYMTDDQ